MILFSLILILTSGSAVPNPTFFVSFVWETMWQKHPEEWWAMFATWISMFGPFWAIRAVGEQIFSFDPEFSCT
jgi:hypothetical protein